MLDTSGCAHLGPFILSLSKAEVECSIALGPCTCCISNLRTQCNLRQRLLSLDPLRLDPSKLMFTPAYMNANHSHT